MDQGGAPVVIDWGAFVFGVRRSVAALTAVLDPTGQTAQKVWNGVGEGFRTEVGPEIALIDRSLSLLWF